MPSPNVIKPFVADSYYHIYNHGVHGQHLFADDEDYAVFLNLFKIYLSKDPIRDRFRRPVANLKNELSLLAYCLMPNHFHLLIYNFHEHGMSNFMLRAMTAYSMYFNKKYKRKGVLFRDSYKASLISDDAYLWHISRYIHLNPQDIGSQYTTYPYSSYAYYCGKKQAEWINPARILDLHDNNTRSYEKFVKDYEDRRAEIKQIEHLLADY